MNPQHLDQILDRASRPQPRPVPEFTAFEADDWEAYQGCETRDPKIATRGRLQIVLDGASLGAALFINENGRADNLGVTALLFGKTFSSPAIAEAVGRSLLFNDEPDTDFLEAMLGECIGEL